MRRLLELPQVLREAGHGRTRVEDDLRAVQAEQTRPFGKVTVVTDVDADGRVPRLEDRIPEVAGLEVVLLPEAGRLRDVVLAVLAQIGAVGVDHGRGVVINPSHFALIDRNHQHHLVGLGEFLQSLHGGPGH